jgi:hypothetical protein
MRKWHLSGVTKRGAGKKGGLSENGHIEIWTYLNSDTFDDVISDMSISDIYP